MRFLSEARIRGEEMPRFEQSDIKDEPMMFNCTADYARINGGQITRAFLDRLPAHFQNAVIDSRVHMLMPGWYPCIPGWHHDDVPRKTPSSQPDYKNSEYFARHAMALVGGDIAPTEFLLGSIEVPDPVGDEAIYGQWDRYLDGDGRKQGMRITAPDRRVILFDANTFHRGTAAVSAGWRWFCRATFDTGRKPTNEIRKQVQVYMPAITAGW